MSISFEANENLKGVMASLFLGYAKEHVNYNKEIDNFKLDLSKFWVAIKELNFEIRELDDYDYKIIHFSCISVINKINELFHEIYELEDVCNYVLTDK